MPDELTAEDRALIEEAAKKSSLVWISATGTDPTGSPQALWHVWLDGAVTVVAGGAEQPLPAFAAGGRVIEVCVRSKDNGGRLTTWLSQVEALTPGTDEWTAAATALHAERLNLAEGDPYLERWATESAILRLKPLGGLVAPDRGSGAARPVPTAAVTLGMQPRMVGGVRRAKKNKGKDKIKG